MYMNNDKVCHIIFCIAKLLAPYCPDSVTTGNLKYTTKVKVRSINSKINTAVLKCNHNDIKTMI